MFLRELVRAAIGRHQAAQAAAPSSAPTPDDLLQMLLDARYEDNGEPMIQVFTSAWPRSWDCAFELLARGGFVISSSLKNAEIEFVQIRSPLGGPCRMKNPWAGKSVSLFRNGARSSSLDGDVLKFETGKGESILLLRAEAPPEKINRAIPEK